VAELAYRVPLVASGPGSGPLLVRLPRVFGAVQASRPLVISAISL